MAKIEEAKSALEKIPEQKAASSTVETLLKSPNIRNRFEEILKDKAAGFISSIVSAVHMNPGLRACDPMSVISAAAIAASMDLPINPSLGFAYMVPYKDKTGFQLGWRGFAQLAMRTGQYKAMNASEVFEDELSFWNAITGEFQMRAPEMWKQRDQGMTEKIVGYVAFFRLLNGFEKFLYMTKAQVEAHGKRYSRSFDSPDGQWKKGFDAMAKKTVIKLLLSRYGILSVDIQKAITVDQSVVDTPEVLVYPDNPEGENSSNMAGVPISKETGKPIEF